MRNLCRSSFQDRPTVTKIVLLNTIPKVLFVETCVNVVFVMSYLYSKVSLARVKNSALYELLIIISSIIIIVIICINIICYNAVAYGSVSSSITWFLVSVDKTEKSCIRN